MLALMTVASAAGADDGEEARRSSSTRSTQGSAARPRARSAAARSRLAEHRQVLCITHLPQIASLADRHFRIEKRPGTDLAHTVVEELAGGAVVDELCRMLGGNADDDGARRHAEALLTAA